jgi:site-specific recombinase XerD
MTTSITTAAPSTLTTAAAGDLDRAAQLANDAMAKATTKAYRDDWRSFQTYCDKVSLDATDPRAVAAYVAGMVETGTPWSTVNRRLSGIRAGYRLANLDDATAHAAVRQVIKGARRTLTVATRNERAPLLLDDLRAMLDVLGDCAAGHRDRALLLVGFGLGSRRSELVALDVADLDWSARGVAVNIRRSKTDQTGAGRVVALPYGRQSATCPVRALRKWLDVAGITSGPVFRSVNRHGRISADRLTDKAVALVVKAVATRADLDPSRLAGHSLRAGLVTTCALAGVTDDAIMRQTGHTSTAMVRRYTRVADAYRNNAAGAVL